MLKTHKIKICGIADKDNLKTIIPLQPDFLGFIFYSKSKRFMAESLTARDLQTIPNNIKKVGVFVNQEIQEVEKIMVDYKLDYAQLHGNELVEYASNLNKKGIKIIKAFGVDSNFDFSGTYAYQDFVEYFLFDTKTENHGGSGRTFNWSKLIEYQYNKPFLLSGGLRIENLDEALKINHKQLNGFDLNSGLEDSPGIKNIELSERVIKKIRHANGLF